MTTRRPALILALLILAFAICPASAQRGNPSVLFDGQSVDQMVAAFMAERQIPGVTLAIVQAPYISRVAGYGVSDTSTKRLASPKTLWNVGQMSRAYTAVAVMQLVEAGKLKLEDTVGKYLPEVPAHWKPVTIRQMLSHTSGLPDYTTRPGYDPNHPYTRLEILQLLKDTPLAFAPGTQVGESATDFFVLPFVIEMGASGSYESFVMINQFERLDLKNTKFSSRLTGVKQESLDGPGGKHSAFLLERPFIDPSEIAAGYTLKDGALTPAPPAGAARWFGNDAIVSSAEDISLWDIGLAGGILVKSKELRDAIYSPAPIAGGTVPANAGWRFPKHKGLMDIAGDVPGASCYLARFTDPGELLCVTLCGNRGGVDFTDLGRRIAGAFDRALGPPAGAPKTSRESTYSVAVTNERLASYLKSHGVAGAAPVKVWQAADGTVWAGYDQLDAAQRAVVEAAVRFATVPY
jgi:CubicO group peptidase (beta-lactamase class C family)